MEQLNEGVEVLPGLMCRLLDEKDLPKVNELIASSYSYQHPGRQIFKVTKDEIGDYDVRAAKENLKSNASLGTFVKETGELVGIAMNTIHTKIEGVNHYNQPVSERLSSSQRFAKYLIGDVFSDLNTNRYLYGSMGCVRSDYRSRGIYSVLKYLEMDLGKNRGCEYVVSVTASLYTQRATKKLGYRILREVPFADYIDPKTGLKPDLNLSSIHTSNQLVYKRILPASEIK